MEEIQSIFKKKEISDLPNDVLLHILQSCSGTDIINFAEAFPSDRIEKVAGDKSLWKNVTIGPKNLRQYLKFLGQYTEEITLLGVHTKVLNKNQVKKAKPIKTDLLPQSVIESIRLRCTNLTRLTLKDIAFDNQEVKVSLFPKSLEDLSLNNVFITNLPQVRVSKAASPFCNLGKYLPKLKRICLHNQWYFDNNDLEAIIDSSKGIPEISGRTDCISFEFKEGDVTSERGIRRRFKRAAMDSIMKHGLNKQNEECSWSLDFIDY